jgi:hypothetical protein
MEFISVLLGMGIGISSVLLGIGLNILYSKLKPYFLAYKVVKGVNFDDLYKNLIDDIKPVEEVKETDKK